MYKNSILSGILGFFVPALRIPRHLRTKKYPFSSARQDKRAKRLYKVRREWDGHVILNFLSNKFLLRALSYDPNHNGYNGFYSGPITSRRNKNKQGAL